MISNISQAASHQTPPIQATHEAAQVRDLEAQASRSAEAAPAEARRDTASISAEAEAMLAEHTEHAAPGHE